MSTIKMQQTYLSALKKDISYAVDYSDTAATFITSAIGGLSSMEFTGKISTIDNLSGLRKRLNKLYRDGNSYIKIIDEYSDNIQAIDDSLNETSEAILGNTTVDTSASDKSSFSFSSATKIANQAITAGLFIGAPILVGVAKLGKYIRDTVKGWFGKLISNNSNSIGSSTNSWNLPNNIPYYSAYFNPKDKYSGAINWDEWPSGYNGAGCMAASYATAMSGFLGRKVTPKEIYEVNGNTLGWQSPGVYERAFGITHVKGITADSAGLDKALDNYLSDPDKYSAPIIYCGQIPHGVVIIGKNSDGSYIMIDSGAKANESNFGRATYQMTTSPGSLNIDGTMSGKMTHIWQYMKNDAT